MGVISKPLQTAIARFAAEHQEYSTPEGAKDKCREASSLFCALLIEEYGIRAYVDEIDVIDWVAHKAAYVGGVWVDWTKRQFNPAAQFPHIEFEDEAA